MPTDNDKIIDLPTDGPGAEVTLPDENVKEGQQPVDVPETKPEGEVTVKETPAPEEKPAELITEAATQVKPELEEYSDGVKKRIAKLTKRMREAERQKDEATKYARNVISEQKTLKARLSKLDTGYVSEMENRIISSLESAQAKLGKAREEGDISAEVDAQKMIAKLGYEEARLAEMKVQNTVREQKQVAEIPRQPINIQQEQKPQPDARATEWAESNAWFGKDSAMTYTAFDMHKKLVEEEGFDPQSEDYYSELDRRIKLEFPHKFGTTTNTIKPTQTVASATRGVNKAGRRTVQLTSSQVAIARKLNVPLEEYAKQLNIEE